MTLYVPAPEEEVIQLTDLYGEAMEVTEPDELPDGKKNPRKGEKRPVVYVYQRFLVERTLDPKFCTHGSVKEGIDAIELLVLARKQIKETTGVVGAHQFDNEVAKRLRETILNPTGGQIGNVGLAHNWLTWVLLWKPEPKDKPPAVLATPAEAAAEPAPARKREKK